MRAILFYIFIVINTTLLGQINDNNSKNDSSKSELSSIKKDSLKNFKDDINYGQETLLKTKDPNKNNSSPESITYWLIISGIIGIFGSTLAWVYNEWQKRINKLVTEKEERYRKLISLIRSFGHGSENNEKANEFILELQLCWMYCPDIVIFKGNAFLETLRPENTTMPDRQIKIDTAKGELILEIRRDLILTGKIFKYFRSAKKLTKVKPQDFKDVYYQK